MDMHDLAPMQTELQRLATGALDAVEEALGMKASGRVVITLDYHGATAAQRASTSGHFRADGYEDRDGGKLHQIAVNPYHIIDRIPAEIVETLLHESIHMVAHGNSIKDTSRQGRYHGKRYRNLTDQSVYLSWVPDKAIGCRTHLTKEGFKLVDTLKPDIAALNVGKALETSTPRPTPKRYTLDCDFCGLSLKVSNKDVARILAGEETPAGPMTVPTHCDVAMHICLPEGDDE